MLWGALLNTTGKVASHYLEMDMVSPAARNVLQNLDPNDP